MNIQELKITQIKVNGDNPRSITGDKFNKLVNSILVFPKMLRLRPIVIDKMLTVIGGNMRTNALREIAKMSAEKLVSRLESLAEYKQRNETERKTIAEYWKKWLKNPVAPTVNAAELTATEREEFIIKDNVSSGNWDYDMLANNFDSSALQSWGMDVWNPQPFAPPTGNGYQAQPQGQPSYSDAPSDAENDGNFEWCEALQIARKNGTVRYSDVRKDIESLLSTSKWELSLNTGCSTNRAKFKGMSVADYMRYLWNNPQCGQSPYKLFYGVLKPAGTDEEGNLIYQYDNAKTY